MYRCCSPWIFQIKKKEAELFMKAAGQSTKSIPCTQVGRKSGEVVAWQVMDLKSQ